LRYNEGSNYRNVSNLDRERLICREGSFEYEQGTVEMPPFFIISKQNGSIINDIQIPYEQKKSTRTMLINGERVSVMPTDATSIRSIDVLNINFYPIIPYQDSWILMEPSSDTIFKFLPDYSMTPLMVRTPSIQTMTPEVFLFPGVLTDRYYFMQTAKKEQDLASRQGFPSTDLVYDRQEKEIYEYTIYNDDYSRKQPLSMFQRAVNNDVAFWHKIEADELVEDFKKGVLKGKLREIAATLKEESNPVIMLVKHKK